MLARKLTTAGPARLSMQQVPAPSRAAPRLRRHLAIVAGLRRQKREEKEHVETLQRLSLALSLVTLAVTAGLGYRFTLGLLEVRGDYKKLDANYERIDANLDRLGAKVDANLDRLSAKVDAKFNALMR